jgi:O-antigen ligase
MSGVLLKKRWGLFLVAFVAVCFVAMGMPTTITFVLATILVFLLAWRAPYLLFYASLVGAPMLAALLSIPLGNFQFGEYAFGGSIDLPLGELVAILALIAWAFRLFIWQHRRHHEWKPWLPLGFAFTLLIGAHLLSLFSLADPDKLLVIKYALRPVLFVYLASIALPVNFLQSMKRLRHALAILVVVGLVFAVDGFLSLFFSGPGWHLVEPMPWFGVYLIGNNHNALAEWLVFIAPASLALATIARSPRTRAFAILAAIWMTGVTLLTFARSAWISIICLVIFLSFTIWRKWIKQNKPTVGALLVALVPLLGAMIVFLTRAEVQSSTSARAMLTGIAWQLFRGNPLFGVGTGTFTSHVNQTWLYMLDFGTVLDSHGILQKIAAETGLLGLAAFAFLLFVLGRFVRRTWLALKGRELERHAFAYLTAGTIGAFIYQLFSTTYWTAKMWLPVGILFAASRIFLARGKKEDPDPDFLSNHV